MTGREPADPGSCTEPELDAPIALCNPDGTLQRAAVGWSRHPVHQCALPGSWGRRKRWDYWCVTAPDVVLSLTYAQVDYVGTADVWCLDRATQRDCKHGAMRPLGRGLAMPDAVGGASMYLDTEKLRLAIVEEPGATRLVADTNGFSCDLAVARPDRHESLGVVIPWSDRRFQYTNKDNTRPVAGTITWGGDRYELADDAWGCLDFGRGKWPYRTQWNWGAASGTRDGRVIGLQLGGKWTAGTGMTENALCVDGRLSKLSEELVWQYDDGDWMRPWRIRTPRSERVDLTFTPEYDKVTRLQAGVMASSVDQCFGTYAGTVVPDDGTPIAIDGLFGWAEEATWRW